MRTKLNEVSTANLIELMNLMGFTSTNHTLNIVLDEALTRMKIKTHLNEVLHGNCEREEVSQM